MLKKVSKLCVPGLWIVFTVVLVYGFSELLPDTPADVTGANKFIHLLERLPTLWEFYALISVSIVVWIYRRRSLRESLQKELDGKLEDRSNRDVDNLGWWVATGLRKRSLEYRARADVILVSLFALLFAGIYLVIFVLGLQPNIDKRLIDEHERQQSYRDKFGPILDSMIEGRHWVKIDRPFEKHQPRRSNIEAVAISRPFVIVNGSDRWKKSDLALGFKPGENIYTALFAENLSLYFGRQGSVSIHPDRVPKWNRTSLEVEKRERIIEAAVSPTGKAVLLASDDGRIFLNDGKSWFKKRVDLGTREDVSVVNLHDDGRIVIAGDEGSIFFAKNIEEDWDRPHFVLARGDVITAVARGSDDTHYVIASKAGRVFETTGKDEGVEVTLPLGRNEYITQGAFSRDGLTGVLASNRGSFFIRTTSKKGWEKREHGERIASVAVSDNGSRIMVVGIRGSMFVTMFEKGKTKEVGDKLETKPRESARYVGPNANGMFGAVAGDEGSVFITEDGAKTWSTPRGFVLRRGQRIVTAKRDEKTKQITFGGIENTVFLTLDGGSTGKRIPVGLDHREDVAAVVFNARQEIGLLAGDEGSAFLTTDKGENWAPLRLPPPTVEGFVGAAVNGDGSSGVLLSERGRIFLTRDTGETWKRTSGLPRFDRRFRGFPIRNRLYHSEIGYVTMTPEGNFLLRRYPELEGWRRWSRAQLLKQMNQDKHLVDSRVFRELAILGIDDMRSQRREVEAQIEDPEKTDGWPFGELFSHTTTIRVVALTFLLFLAQILVRLNRYCVRLASFCDSRADAVLLAGSLAENRSQNFDDLVRAMAPDTYDFKPLSWSLLSSLRRSARSDVLA